jgi:putative ATPase
VQEEIKKGASESVPMHLRNPVTPLMKDMGYGKDYKYAHDYPGHVVEQQHLPDSIKEKRFYTPGVLGYESQILEQLKKWWIKKANPEETGGPAEGGKGEES